MSARLRRRIASSGHGVEIIADDLCAKGFRERPQLKLDVHVRCQKPRLLPTLGGLTRH
jgi:hypothetical protein